MTDAIRGGAPVPRAWLAALHAFTRSLVAERAMPSRGEVAAFLAAGYRAQQILETVLAIAVNTLSNIGIRWANPPMY